MEDGDSDAEMADYGTDFSDDHDVDPNFDASSLLLVGHSRIGNRIPRSVTRFPGLGGDFPIPDSEVPEWPGIGNRETFGPFPVRPGTGNRGPDSASRGFPGLVGRVSSRLPPSPGIQVCKAIPTAVVDSWSSSG